MTTLNTLDNVRTFIGNNRMFSDTIQSYSVNSYRRVDLVAQLDNSVDPKPDVEILQFTALGPVLAVRPYWGNEYYWQVYFDANRTIRETCGAAGFPAPEQRVLVRNLAGSNADLARTA